MKTLQDLIGCLDKLEEKQVKFHLGKIRDSILIELIVADQMWEIEFMEDGAIEIEKFIRSGDKLDEKALDVLICEFAEAEEDEPMDFTVSGTDVFGILKVLDRAKIFYTLDRDKENDSIIIVTAVPGQRWRIEISSDRSLGTEKYLTTTQISDEKELNHLFDL